MTKRELKELLSALQLEQVKFGALADKMEMDVFKGLARAQQRAYSRIEAIILESPDWKTLSMNRRLEWWVQNKKSIEAALIDNGYGDAVKAYVDDIPKFADLSKKLLDLQGIKFSGYPDDLIENLQSAVRSRFRGIAGNANAAIHKVVFDNVIAGVKRSDALPRLKGLITGSYPWKNRTGLYEWHAGTYVRTTHIQVARELQAGAAREVGIEKFLYLGPFDQVTRPFCSGIVGKVFTRDEIEQLDNGTELNNSFTDGGGWNCRHTWIPASDTLAKALEENPDTVDEVVGNKFPKEFTPAKTLKEAQDYATNTIGVRGVSGKTFPGTVPLDEAGQLAKLNRMNQAAHHFLAREPRARAFMQNLEFRVIGDSRGRTYLGAHKDLHGFSLTDRWEITGHKAVDQKIFFKLNGYHSGMQRAEAWMIDNFRHELGHRLTTYKVGEMMQAHLLAAKKASRWKVYARKLIGDYGTTFRKNPLTHANRYAEFIAEAFNLYTRPNYVAGTLPKGIEKIMEHMLNQSATLGA